MSAHLQSLLKALQSSSLQTWHPNQGHKPQGLGNRLFFTSQQVEDYCNLACGKYQDKLVEMHCTAPRPAQITTAES